MNILPTVATLLFLLLLPHALGADLHLRIWRHWKAGAPYIEGYPELSSSGDTLVNRTQSAPSWASALNPGPTSGKLYQRGTGKTAYLQPLTTPPGHYAVKWAKPVPSYGDDDGIKWHNFTVQPQMCGGNCGGIGLAYAGAPNFFVVPHETLAGAWVLRWSEDTWVFPVPAGGYYVYVWAN